MDQERESQRSGGARALRLTGTTLKVTGKGALQGVKLVGKASVSTKKALGKGAHRAFGGHRYAARMAEVNERIATAFAQMDAALRFKDAEIEELRAQNLALRAQLEAE